VNSCGAVPLDRAGRPRPAWVRNQAKPDQGVGLRARAPAPQDPPGTLSSRGRFASLVENVAQAAADDEVFAGL